MKAAVFFTALILSLTFAEYAVASGMMGMSILEFFVWGWRL